MYPDHCTISLAPVVIFTSDLLTAENVLELFINHRVEQFNFGQSDFVTSAWYCSVFRTQEPLRVAGRGL